MSNKKMELTPRIVEITPEFYSYDTNKLFSNCINCNKFLLDGETYIIEKAIKQYVGQQKTDVIFEYAMCTECVEKMRKKLSEISLTKINEYILKNSDFENRTKTLLKNEKSVVKDWLSNCLIKKTNIAELPEYQIACLCQGKYMILSHLPYLISFEAADEISELLSKQTKDELDNFYKENLGIPPELEDFFNKPKILIV